MLLPREFCQGRTKEHDLVIGVGDHENDAGSGQRCLEESSLEEAISAHCRDQQGVEGVEPHRVFWKVGERSCEAKEELNSSGD